MKIYNAGNRIMNTYVYHASSGYIMISTGYEHSLGDVERKLNKQGVAFSDVRYIFLTHAHDDHAGFLNELLSKYAHIQVIINDTFLQHNPKTLPAQSKQERNNMIRPIKKTEIETCVEVIKTSFLTVAQEYGFTKENAPRFTAFSTTPERLHWQYREGRPMYGYFDENGQLLGYYSLHIQEKEECELNNLCVLPDYRHNHIGEILFSHALATANEKGCKKITIGIVEENRVLRAWYEKLGAKHIGTKKFDFFPFTCGYMEKETRCLCIQNRI